MAEELLLTPEEQKIFAKMEATGYGDITVTEEHWDIEGLLKAQLAKAKPIIAKQLLWADKNYLDLKNTFDERIEEAIRQEGERIEQWAFGDCNCSWRHKSLTLVKRKDCPYCWQALKGGK